MKSPIRQKPAAYIPNLRDGTLRRNWVNHPKGVATALT